MVLTIIVFLVILSILVLVHEFGHFVVGRACGIAVEEFALGLPFTKPLISRKLKDGMKLSLYPLLFGGFVKLKGEETEETSKDSFNQKNVWQRIAVVIAGVMMNLVLAIIASYVFLSLVGFKYLLPRLADYQFKSPSKSLVAITLVEKGTPADLAGLALGDVLISANNQEFRSISDFQDFIKKNAGTEVSLTISDSNLEKTKTLTLTPRKDPPVGEGPLGVAITEAVALEYLTPGQKILSGLNYSQDMFLYNIKVISSFANIAVKTKTIEPLSESVSGPVGIASAVGSILDLGGGQAVAQLINLLALLSLSLAFMNILPFPALDGGRLVFLLVEALTRKKIAAKYENWVNQAGMAVLLVFIVLVSFNDLSKIISPLISR